MPDANLTSPTTPAFGEPLEPIRRDPETLSYLSIRRSTPVGLLGEPGPDRDQIEALLKVAARVPDHGKLAPWRFILILGEAREKLGVALADALVAKTPDASPGLIELEKGRFLRAPSVVAVISRARQHHKIPIWEQQLSAGAVCYNLLLAAQAMGFAGVWLTEPPAYSAEAASILGLASDERVAGFVYLGTARENPRERERPDMAALVSEWR